MLKFRQYFCSHDYKYIAHHDTAQMNLWKCKKCGVFYIQHYGIDAGYKCKFPNVSGWEKFKN
ncbi:hypothetical protein CON92_26510 [Bacillus wiedmannii]|nr:hypothetical protein CON92_26510 [Bacillus wiedmannii]